MQGVRVTCASLHIAADAAYAGVLSRETAWEQKEQGVLMDSLFFLLARRKGLEPLTFWFVAKHSIQLS